MKIRQMHENERRLRPAKETQPVNDNQEGSATSNLISAINGSTRTARREMTVNQLTANYPVTLMSAVS